MSVEKPVIKRLTYAMVDERAEVAKIHADELPDSDLSVLGATFLYHFYYGLLLKEPDYYCYFYLAEGEVAGFTTFSTDSKRVCWAAAVRYWPELAWTIFARIVRQPKTILTIIQLAGSLLPGKQTLYSKIKAEAMSTAVARNYRGVEYFRRSGTNIAQLLYLTIASVLNDRGIKKVKGFI